MELCKHILVGNMRNRNWPWGGGVGVVRKPPCFGVWVAERYLFLCLGWVHGEGLALRSITALYGQEETG